MFKRFWYNPVSLLENTNFLRPVVLTLLSIWSLSKCYVAWPRLKSVEIVPWSWKITSWWKYFNTKCILSVLSPRRVPNLSHMILSSRSVDNHSVGYCLKVSECVWKYEWLATLERPMNWTSAWHLGTENKAKISIGYVSICHSVVYHSFAA